MTRMQSASAVGDLLERAISRLVDAGRENPRRNAEWLLADVLDIGRAGLYARMTVEVPPDGIVRFEQLVQRRVDGEPLQYILGFTEFFGLRILVGPGVLIPRPETEELVEVALASVAHLPSPRVLDVGSGSGCIALAVKSERPDADVTGCDVSSEALKLARRNADLLGLDVDFVEADVRATSFHRAIRAPIDLLISNPPYVPEAEIENLPVDVRLYEPQVALLAPGEPLTFYRHLAAQGQSLIRKGGWVAVETHADYGGKVADLYKKEGYQDVDVKEDLAGRDRIVIARR